MTQHYCQEYKIHKKPAVNMMLANLFSSENAGDHKIKKNVFNIKSSSFALYQCPFTVKSV